MLKLQIIQPEDVINNNWTVERVSEVHPPSTWENVFKDCKNELKDISEILENDKKVNGNFYPDCKNLFRCFELTPLPRVKVVILGQDPFYGLNHDKTPQADGLAYSVKKGVKVPPVTVNIFKELQSTVDGFNTPSHGNLSGWAQQGVLLMNSCLTTSPENPGSHKELWYGFVKKIINAILDVNPNCVFVVWGRKVQKVRKMLGERAVVLEAAHPSAYSGFLKCNHFNEINTILREKGFYQINWQV